MHPKLRILHLEDNPIDAELIKSTLHEEGLDCDIMLAATRDDFLKCINQEKFDLILTDFSIPSFDGFSALQVAREKYPDVPVIFVSGSIGEEFAIEILKKGATDYVLKDKLLKLVSSMNRALHEVEEKEKRRRAEEALKESEQKFRVIFDHAADGILIADIETKKFYSGNKMICRMLGYSGDEIRELGVSDIHPEEELPRIVEQFEKQANREIITARDSPVKRKDGTVFYADINSFPIILGGKTYLVGIFRDITERRHIVEELLKREEELRKRVRELEDFYEMGIGRELRMIELKKEIKSLKEELRKYKKDDRRGMGEEGRMKIMPE